MAKQRWMAFLVALVMAWSLTACGGSGKSPGGTDTQQPSLGNPNPAPTPEGKNDLIFALDSEPASLDPYMHTKQQGFTVGTLIFETLIKSDGNGGYLPWLATEWEQVDETTFIFKLRDDVTFHNGSKLTAEDAAYSLALGSQSSFSATIFGSIDPENTKAIDEYTLELKLTTPYAPLLDALASFRGAILCKEAREEMGADAYGRAPVGTGPMQFKEWVSGDRIEMEAYEGYWGEKPPFVKATGRIIVEASSRSIELETGGVDIAMEVSFSDWSRIDESPDTVLISGESQTMTFLLMNNSLEPFDDINFRKALAHAINMDALVNVAYQGKAKAANSFYIPSLLGYMQVGPYEYNLELAKEYLTAAGFPNGTTITYYTQETQVNMAIAEVVENMWSQIGVKCDIQMIDLATMTEMNNAGQITVASMGPAVAIADPDAALMIWPTYRTISIRHHDEYVQELLDRGRSTYVDSERIAAYQELQDYLFEKCYSLPIAFPLSAFGTRSNITGLQFAPSLVPDLAQVRFG